MAGGIGSGMWISNPLRYTDPDGRLAFLAIPEVCAAGGCEALAAAAIMMSAPGKKAIKSIAQKIRDICNPDDKRSLCIGDLVTAV
jgi:hypothetical protein